MRRYTQRRRSYRRRRHYRGGAKGGEEERIVHTLLEMLMMVKLFHWKTTSYAAHKASDELYTQLNLHIDSFVEIMLGKTGGRVQMPAHSSLALVNVNSLDALRPKVEEFKSFLVNLDQHLHNRGGMTNTDLLNVRDTILGDMNQFLYLLTFE